MSLINCKINLILTWSENCFLVVGIVTNLVPKILITDGKLYVSVVNLSTLGNTKLPEQLNLILKEQLTGINTNQKQL